MDARLFGIAATAVLLGSTPPETTTRAEEMAYQTILEATTVEGRGRALANELQVTTDGDAVLVRWSLSYAASASTSGGERGRRRQVVVDLVAGLVRDDDTLAEWHLDYATAYQDGDRPAAVHVRGTASAMLVDPAPAGRHRYRLEVRDDGPGMFGRSLVVRSRTMIVDRP